MTSQISISNYQYKTWKEKYPDHEVNLKKLHIDSQWKDFFSNVKKDEQFNKIEEHIKKSLDVTDGKIKIYPYPDLVFSSLNMTPLNEIKVVIIGQDPYHKNECHGSTVIPQAMGLSFSVPVGIKIPSSLNNIYKNMLEYGHLDKMPTHGNLESWAKQGVLLLNTAFTVQHGFPNSHAKYWKWLTDALIGYISDNTDNVVFVLWGRPAYGKSYLIDKKRHKIIVSSHPSGLSCHKTMGDFPSFKETNHFKIINKYLERHGKNKINWKNI